MTATPEAARRLLDWRVPDARHAYTSRDTALYALSVGAGRSPLDRRGPTLVDPWHDAMQVLPSMALVLGYPGFWLGSPQVRDSVGLDPAAVLHVEQSVRLHGPLPAQAQVVGRTRVLGLADKGGDRGSLLYSERTIHRQDDGTRLATCRQVHYLRGFGGFGSMGQPYASDIKEASGAAQASMEIEVRPEQAALYRLNGDANPIHIDPDIARAAGFASPILHGMCTIGMVCRAVVENLLDCCPERMAGFDCRMTAPVLPGERLRLDMWQDGSFHALSTERDVGVLRGVIHSG